MSPNRVQSHNTETVKGPMVISICTAEDCMSEPVIVIEGKIHILYIFINS